MRTIGFGSVDERYVFMDERTDTYFVIAREFQPDVDRAVDHGGILQRGCRLRAVLDLGDEPARLVRTRQAPPSRSLLEGHGLPRARPGDVLKAAFLLRSTRSQLRSRPIEAVLDDVFAKGRKPVSDERLVEQTLRFMAARRFVPSRPNCLLDSLSLARWLGGMRSCVSILFGVKLDPFAAHCWIQSGTLLLNDRIENVAAFIPVRAIGCSALSQ